MLDRAQRLQRQFFTHAQAAWEPPVDIVETQDGLQVHVALPGVSAEGISVGLDPAGISVSAVRPFPCREEGSQIHRLEIPYGRFERRLTLGDGKWELVARNAVNGCLQLLLARR